MKTLPDGWKLGQSRSENLPEGWRPADQDDKSLPDGWKIGELAPGVNTPTASLRNTIKGETLQDVVDSSYEEPMMREEGVNTLTASMRNTFSEEIIDEVVMTTNIEKPVMGVEGVTTLTASKRNTITNVPEDKAVPDGGMEHSATTGGPAKAKRRIRGKLSDK